MNSSKSVKWAFTRLGKNLYFSIAFIVSCLIVFKSIDYLHPDFSKGFLSNKQEIFDVWFKYALYVHMSFAPLTIFAGILQFSLDRKKALHRISGYVYMAGALFGSVSGFIMAFHSIGGWWSGMSFIILATLWFLFTLKAFTSIRSGNVEAHRLNMTRSFILANSAILLRILAFAFNQFITDPIQAYILISWLCWVPPLLTYESIRLFSKKAVFKQ